MPKHYHTLSGLSGDYMPDDAEVHQDKASARRDAKERAGAYRDAGYKVRRESLDFYTVNNGNFYVEVTECYDKDCALHQDSIFNI